jgi:hypothetical protein
VEQEEKITMPAESNNQQPQFENPEAAKLERETNAKDTPRKQVDRVAEELAEKSSKAEKNYDAQRPEFTK